MTTSEYLRTPESVLPTELVYGRLRVAESPAANHQRVVRELAWAIGGYLRTHGGGELLFAPMDVVLDRDAHLVVQPDLLVVTDERREIVSDRVYGPPDLVIEVLSPHPRIGSLHERVEWFAKYGVRECWLVSIPQRQIAVLSFADGRVAGQTVHENLDSVCTRIFPALQVVPHQIFGW